MQPVASQRHSHPKKNLQRNMVQTRTPQTSTGSMLILGVDSPFFSTIALFKNQSFSLGSLERMELKGTFRVMGGFEEMGGPKETRPMGRPFAGGLGLGLRSEQIIVQEHEEETKLRVVVERFNGATGEIGCRYYTEDPKTSTGRRVAVFFGWVGGGDSTVVLSVGFKWKGCV